MGQAKLRGSFEDRKAAAVLRNEEADRVKAASMHAERLARLSATQALATNREAFLRKHPLPAAKMQVGGRYNWKGQSERLIYTGYNWSSNGYWHQFELVDKPGVVWCEILDSDLQSIEETTVQ